MVLDLVGPGLALAQGIWNQDADTDGAGSFQASCQRLPLTCHTFENVHLVERRHLILRHENVASQDN